MAAHFPQWVAQVTKASELYRGGGKTILFLTPTGELVAGTEREMKQAGGRKVDVSQIVDRSISFLADARDVPSSECAALAREVRVLGTCERGQAGLLTRVFQKALLAKPNFAGHLGPRIARNQLPFSKL